jgi:AraC-like DNA-binding protein
LTTTEPLPDPGVVVVRTSQRVASRWDRVAPSPALHRLVSGHWIERWDLGSGDPVEQHLIHCPAVRLTVDAEQAAVRGVATNRTRRSVAGAGWAVTTIFRPGAFTASTGIPASRLTDRSLSLRAALGREPEAWESDPRATVDAIEALLAPYAEIDDPTADVVGSVMASMERLKADASVEDIATMHSLGLRALQSLFRRYVGASPAWTLRRLRIYRALVDLPAAYAGNWTAIALRLGYYDLADFVRDFSLVVGESPRCYASEAARTR